MRVPSRTAALAAAVLTALSTIVVGTAIVPAARADEAAAAATPALDAATVAALAAARSAPLTSSTKVELQQDVRARQALAVARARVVAREARVTALRERVIRIAKRQLGDPYIAGRMGPNAFDCSGFTRYVYEQATGRTLPHYSRAQYRVVKRISKKQARPGDLVFFFRNGAEHVGIYLGNGRMIDAANPRRDVSINPISGSWWGRSYTGMGRVLPG